MGAPETLGPSPLLGLGACRELAVFCFTEESSVPSVGKDLKD